jgi:hypothetical protein
MVYNIHLIFKVSCSVLKSVNENQDQ